MPSGPVPRDKTHYYRLPSPKPNWKPMTKPSSESTAFYTGPRWNLEFPSSLEKDIVSLKQIEYGFGYATRRSPFSPYSIYLKGTIASTFLARLEAARRMPEQVESRVPIAMAD